MNHIHGAQDAFRKIVDVWQHEKCYKEHDTRTYEGGHLRASPDICVDPSSGKQYHDVSHVRYYEY